MPDTQLDDLLCELDVPTADTTQVPTPTAVPAPPAEPARPQIDVAAAYAQHEAVTDEVIMACRHDRAETQSVIDMLRAKFIDDLSQNRDSTRHIVEGLVTALQAKASINSTAIRALDARTKLIGATRAGLTVNNNNIAGSVTAAELHAALNAPLNGDDQF